MVTIFDVLRTDNLYDWVTWTDPVSKCDFATEWTKDSVIITCDMPGVKVADVSVEGTSIYVKATRMNDKSQVIKTYSYNYDVKRDLDLENIKSNLADGLFTLTVPFAIIKNVKKFQVNSR